MDKKKGFTLIELLATIVIVALVFIISGVLIYNKKDVDERLTSAQESLIINSASDFVNEFRNRKDNWLENISDDGASFCVSLTSLIDLGFFKSNSDDYIMKNKDKLLVSVKVDANQVYSYDIIINSDDNINASCLYKDIDSFLSNTKDSIDIKNENSTSIGTLGYDITKISNTKYDVKTDLSVKLGSDMIEIDAPVYVAIVLDNSGSMIGDAWDRAKEASIELSKTIVDNITSSKVALIQYGDSPMLVRDFEHKVLSSNSFVEAGGGTNVSGSLDLVASLYKELDIPSYAKLYTILLYDGAVNYYSYLKENKTSNAKYVYNRDTSVYYNNFLSAFNKENGTYTYYYGKIINYTVTTMAKYSIDSAKYLKNNIGSKLISIGYNFDNDSSLGIDMKQLSSIDNSFCDSSDYIEEITETSNVDLMPSVELKTHQITYPFEYNEETKSISSTNSEIMTESYEVYELDLTGKDDEFELKIDYTFSYYANMRDYLKIVISESKDRTMAKLASSACYTSKKWSAYSYCDNSTGTTKTNIDGGKKYYIHVYMEKNYNSNYAPKVTINSITYSNIKNKTIYDSQEDGFNKEPIATLSTEEESRLVYGTTIEDNSLVLPSYGGFTGGYEKIDLSDKEGNYLLTLDVTSLSVGTGIIYISENSYQPVAPFQHRPLSIKYGYNDASVCNQKNMRCFFTSFENNDFNFTLEGGKIYYVHFIHDSKNVQRTGFKINKISLIKIGEQVLDVDLEKISDESCLNYSDIVSCLNKSDTYNFYFIPDNGSFISTNKEVSNSCSHNYSEVDLTSYSESENFIVNFDTIISSHKRYSYAGDYGLIIVSDSAKTPVLSKMSCNFSEDYNCVAMLSGTSSNNAKIKLSGGKKYYIHFMYCKNNSGDYQDYFIVNKFKVYKGIDYKSTTFPVDVSNGFTDIVNYNNYSFEDIDNKLVSTNQGIYNSASYRKVKIDLTGYSSSERFIITVNGNDNGRVILHRKETIKYINSCDKNIDPNIITCLLSLNPQVIVTGGVIYYLHFVYQKGTNVSQNDTYIIDSVKIEQIVPDNAKELDLSKGLYEVKNYSFQESQTENGIIYVSDNLDIYNSAYSYFKLDLSDYSSEKVFNININSTAENSGRFNLYISPHENIPYIYFNGDKDEIIRKSYTSSGTNDFSTELKGGKVYYVHFFHSAETVLSSKFTINSIKLSKVSVIGKNSYCYYDSNTEQISNVFSNLSSKVVTNTQKFEADKVKITLTAVKNDDATFHIEDNDGKTFDYVEQEFKISELTQEEENKILELAMDNYHFVLDTIEKQCNNDDGCEIETKIFKLKLDIYSNNSDVISKTVELAEENLPTVKIKYKEGKAIN